MAQPPRTPPRFVPTLTDVVQVPDAAPGQGAPAAPLRTTVAPPPALPPVAQPSITNRPPLPSAKPPAVMTPRPATAAPAPAVGAAIRSPSAAPSAMPAPVAPARPVPTAAPRRLPDGMEEYMVHRVMQRVDVVLDQRLREAIAAVVQEQTRSVLPRLREEIESVVRNAVYEAVADELASGAPAVPKG